MRIRYTDKKFRQASLIHLGDHDPSGIDMTRDNGDRLNVFGAHVHVHRVALNYDQVEEFNPPPNPAKMTDTRAAGYIARFGNTSWELDALQPATIERIVEGKIRDLIDEGLFEAAKRDRREKRSVLRWISDNADDVLAHAEKEASQ